MDDKDLKILHLEALISDMVYSFERYIEKSFNANHELHFETQELIDKAKNEIRVCQGKG